MEENKLKVAINNATEKAKEKFESVKAFCTEHKELVVALAPVAVSGLVEFAKIAARNGTLKQQRELKDNYIYDRSNGHYYELRRKPTQKEWIEIDHRKEMGQSIGSILMDMGLLK